MMSNSQVQDFLNTFRSKLDAHETTIKSKRIVQQTLDISDQLERMVALLAEAGWVVDPQPLIAWTTPLRETLRAATSDENSEFDQFLQKARAMLVLPELVSPQQLLDAHTLLERVERLPTIGKRGRRPPRVGLDRRNLPFGVRLVCDSCREIVAGTRDAGVRNWSSLLLKARRHNDRHTEEWPDTRSALGNALKILVDATETRAGRYLLLKR
jgi:hypothetical protein